MGEGLDERAFAAALHEAIGVHESVHRRRLDRLWRFYRNEGAEPHLHGQSHAAVRTPALLQGQAQGLPPRLRGVRRPDQDDRIAPAEVVIENDIAWRVHTMVDFMFGRAIRVRSMARSEPVRRAIEATLDAVWESSGGIALLQEMGLLGHVFGHVDLVLRADATALALLRESGGADARSAPLSTAIGDGRSAPGAVGSALRIDVIDPRRGVPVLHEGDYRVLRGYAVRAEQPRTGYWAQGHGEVAKSGEGATQGSGSFVTEIYLPWSRRVERDGQVLAVEEQRLFGGALPIVHVQNIAQPFSYWGMGEVEPLIPLQNELNTRLSDRASRVTMQSFKMYLARGIEGFETMPVGPGRVWSTDNPDAAIESFGGDAASPSEDAHIKEVREAMDKVSGVPPLSTGVVQGRVGNLSSANALRITLVGLLAKTARKRVTYGRGIAAMSELVLSVLDASGVLVTDPVDRGIQLEWADPLPEDALERTLAAKRKVELGVSSDEVLDELGYAPSGRGGGINTDQNG